MSPEHPPGPYHMFRQTPQIINIPVWPCHFCRFAILFSCKGFVTHHRRLAKCHSGEGTVSVPGEGAPTSGLVREMQKQTFPCRMTSLNSRICQLTAAKPEVTSYVRPKRGQRKGKRATGPTERMRQIIPMGRAHTLTLTHPDKGHGDYCFFFFHFATVVGLQNLAWKSLGRSAIGREHAHRNCPQFRGKDRRRRRGAHDLDQFCKRNAMGFARERS